MSLYDDLLASSTLASVRQTLIGYAQAASLQLTAWLQGSTGEQVLQTVSLAAYATSQGMTRLARGFASLDTATDPGDPDDANPSNGDLTPAPGFLSAKGENDFGTTRGSETFANGTWTFQNTGVGAVTRTFAPEALTFTWTLIPPIPSPAPTYRNAADPAIYTNPDGTVTVLAGATLDIHVVAEEIGTRSNAPAGALTLTTTLIGVTGSNAAAVLGTDREDADLYRARCRQALARTSLGGAADIYEYLATKNIDGTPLLNADGDEVAITRVWFTDQSPNGTVDGYYADATGAPIAADVTAANANITTYALATPGAITFTGAAAVEVPIAVVGTGKIKSRAGTSDLALKAEVEQAMSDALALAFPEFPIGGVDQTLGAGVIYTTDLRQIAADAYAGLYNVQVTTPAGASTALAQGEVATLAGATFTVTVVA